MTENYVGFEGFRLKYPSRRQILGFSYALFLISLWKEQLTQPHKKAFNFVINILLKMICVSHIGWHHLRPSKNTMGVLQRTCPLYIELEYMIYSISY